MSPSLQRAPRSSQSGPPAHLVYTSTPGQRADAPHIGDPTAGTLEGSAPVRQKGFRSHCFSQGVTLGCEGNWGNGTRRVNYACLCPLHWPMNNMKVPSGTVEQGQRGQRKSLGFGQDQQGPMVRGGGQEAPNSVPGTLGSRGGLTRRDGWRHWAQVVPPSGRP